MTEPNQKIDIDDQAHECSDMDMDLDISRSEQSEYEYWG